MKQNLEYKFQFHKSTIKTPKTAPPSLCLLYFNSIKVRLKQDTLPEMSVGRVFQFHKGTIKTSCRRSDFTD